MSDWLTPIFDAWDGNATAMANDIGEQPVKTNQWRARGRIPDEYRTKIIEKAWEKRGKRLTLLMFIHPDHRGDVSSDADVGPDELVRAAAPDIDRALAAARTAFDTALAGR